MSKLRSERWKTVRRVLKYTAHQRIYLILAIVFAAISVGLTLYLPLLTGRAVDLLIGKGAVDFAALTKILVRMAIVIGMTAIAQWILSICNNRVTYITVRDIRKDAFEHLQHLPLKYIDGHPVGDIVSRIIADVDTFADGLLMGFTQLFTGVMTIIGTLAFMLSINVGTTIVVVVVTPVSLLVASFIARRTYSMFKAQSETRGEQTALINEVISGQKVVKAFGREKEYTEKFAEINGRLQKCSLQATFFSSLVNPCTRFVNSLVYAGVAVFGSLAALTSTSVMTVGMITTFLTYANQYTKPFNEISGVVTELQNAIACAARIFELMDEEVESTEADTILRPEETDGSVEIEDLSFSYTPEKKLIEDFSLSVVPGQRVAIVGPTGCGKTTMINLLMRFYEPDEGRIIVSGKPVTEITRKSLRAGYAMVLQDTWIRTGSIRSNITMGREATTSEVVAAAKAANAHSFIRRMPNGYDTILAENGEGLSEGQKQLLCIARAMLRLPQMLILDEATSSIDTRTELKVQGAFDKMMKGRTCFIVAHRLSTIEDADVILVMRDGKIVETGAHEELLRRGGFYADLYNSQFAH